MYKSSTLTYKNSKNYISKGLTTGILSMVKTGQEEIVRQCRVFWEPGIGEITKGS